MTQRRFLILLAAALVGLALALYFSGQRHPSRDSQGGLLLPALRGEFNGISAVTIRKGAAKPTVSLRRSANHWTVVELDNYPADSLKLRRLLLALSEARLTEEKTSNPASYPIIGVEDPASPSAAGSEISLVAPQGTQTLIIGKPVGNGNFVRYAGGAASYVAEPGISFETEPRYWIDTRLVDIPLATIQGIAVHPADGPAYALHRVSPAADAFALETVPAGRTAVDPKSLGPSPTAFANLAAEDVAAATSVDFGNPSTLVLSLSDGDAITLTGAAVGDKRWLQLASTKDAALETKAKGRAFAIPRYRYDAIFRPLEQLLQPRPTRAPKSAPLAAPAPKPKVPPSKPQS